MFEVSGHQDSIFFYGCCRDERIGNPQSVGMRKVGDQTVRDIARRGSKRDDGESVDQFLCCPFRLSVMSPLNEFACRNDRTWEFALTVEVPGTCSIPTQEIDKYIRVIDVSFRGEDHTLGKWASEPGLARF